MVERVEQALRDHAVQRVRQATARLALLDLAPQDQPALEERVVLLDRLARAALLAIKVLPDQQVLEILDQQVRWQLVVAQGHQGQPERRDIQELTARLDLPATLDPSALVELGLPVRRALHQQARRDRTALQARLDPQGQVRVEAVARE